MKWTDEKIVAWHKKTFPDCTFESQLAKLDEELKEVSDAQKKGNYEQSFDELADVYIVATVLKERFNSTIATYFLEMEDAWQTPSLFERVDRKMDTNQKRTWCKVNGVYRHKEEE
jgi:NTP pyrophosphatase (non-canonical NTP hydrolase)